jgi:hypothetical protein
MVLIMLSVMNVLINTCTRNIFQLGVGVISFELIFTAGCRYPNGSGGVGTDCGRKTSSGSHSRYISSQREVETS